MIDKINKIVNMLNTTNEKDSFRDAIYDLNDSIKSFLKQISFNPQNVKHIEIKQESIKNIETKLEQLKENPEKCLFEGIQKYKEIMHNFLECYHFGFLKDFYLISNGKFKCCIPILISKSTFTTTPISDKINFENQLTILKNEGIELSIGKRDEIKISATQANMSALKKLLNKIGASHIEMKLIQYQDTLFIREINFWTSPECLENFTDKNESYCLPVTKELNQDEIQYIYKNLKDIAHAIDGSEIEGLSDTCGDLICSYFSSICKTLNIETEISKKLEEKYKKEREQNLKIKALKHEIAQNITPEILKSVSNKIYNYLNDTMSKKINFSCDSIEISQYNIIVNAKIISGFWIEDDLMKEQDFKKLFDCREDAKRRKYSLVPFPTEKNIKILEDFIFNNFGSTEIDSIKINSKNVEYQSITYKYIEEIQFRISNINFI